MSNPAFNCPPTDLRKKLKPGRRSVEVQYSVSYSYNGGVVIDGAWHPGYRVPPPLIPDDCELVGIGVGLQLNARPPYATAVLRRKEKPS